MIEKININKLGREIRPFLAHAVGGDYAFALTQDEAFVSAVAEDLEAASAWSYDGSYVDDDIRLAIGRVIMKRFEIYP